MTINRECINEVRYIYTIEYYLTVKKKNNETMLFATTRMDLEIILLNKVRERRISHDITYVNLKRKMIQMNFTKQKQAHRLLKQIYG